MLQLKKICKKYLTGDLMQTALDEVSLTLRDNEFVAILGPSGSGKTTMLNIIGGLDRYDSGDLIVNDVSTKDYTDKDWDSYRNHAIGFVFQNYNLIMHQSILSNVELALTLSGVSAAERRERAIKALEEVGLGEQIHKKPNQLSGGQMQRVAIARALINDPEILLADEPTGALDTETSIQVMDLLKKVADDRLVVMVTHNPELAEQYATRIVKLKDGKIIDDSNPVEPSEHHPDGEHANMGKSSMSFWTAMNLSFNNLKTKKKRTILTACAGSIGIIGIALIMSLSNGVNQYITDIQKDTMTSYPITIQSETIDLTSMMQENQSALRDDTVSHGDDEVYSNNFMIERASGMSANITENNLTDFKNYLESDESGISEYISDLGIQYGYDVSFGVYSYDPDGQLVTADGVTIEEEETTSSSSLFSSMASTMISTVSGNSGDSPSIFEELLPGNDSQLVSDAIKDNYDLVYGTWPENATDVVLILDKNNEVSLTALYELGLLPSSDYEDLMDDLENGKEVDIEQYSWSYKDITGQPLYLLCASDLYVENEDGTFSYQGDTVSGIEEQLDQAYKLNISGIIRLNADSDNQLVSSPIGYTSALTDELINHINESAVVLAQEASPDTNVLNGYAFEVGTDEEKIEDAKEFLKNLDTSRKATMARSLMSTMSEEELSSLMGTQSSSSMSAEEIAAAQAAGMDVSSMTSSSAVSMTSMSEDQLADLLDKILDQSDDDEMFLNIYDTYISTGTYNSNMQDFGKVSLDAPSSISIYTDSFEHKEAVTDVIDAYNQTVDTEDQITYTDYVGLLMSSVTTIINLITYVLIGFVGLSLVVSSIMIGIITYISVLERTKEIGILRAIGASKHNISEVFNAETLMIGLLSGGIGVGVSYLLLIPMNAIIHALSGNTAMNAYLPIGTAIILVLLSMFLTFIGGLIPANSASKKDPVIALRSE